MKLAFVFVSVAIALIAILNGKNMYTFSVVSALKLRIFIFCYEQYIYC